MSSETSLALQGEVVDRVYLRRTRPTIRHTYEQILAEFNSRGLHPPALRTVRARLLSISSARRAAYREGTKGARKHIISRGQFPSGTRPLQTILIDHTPLDIQIVDSTDCRLLFAKREITSEDVGEVIESLVRDDMPVTYLAVAEALAVSSDRIRGTPSLRTEIDRALPVVLRRWCANMRDQLSASRDRLRLRGVRLSRARLAEDAGVSLEAIARFESETGETYAVSPSETYADQVTQAIASLRASGTRITTTAVCRELGRERSFIEKRPDLKQIVRVARDAKPTVEEVRSACVLLRGYADDSITTLGVARELGCSRHVIERSETLRAVMEEQRAIERREIEEKIRAAIKTLCERGEAVTMASVARVMGLSRAGIEKRGRLREIVLRARRGESLPSATSVPLPTNRT